MGDNENTIRSGALKKTSFRLDFSEPSAKTRGKRMRQERGIGASINVGCFNLISALLAFYGVILSFLFFLPLPLFLVPIQRAPSLLFAYFWILPICYCEKTTTATDGFRIFHFNRSRYEFSQNLHQRPIESN